MSIQYIQRVFVVYNTSRAEGARKFLDSKKGLFDQICAPKARENFWGPFSKNKNPLVINNPPPSYVPICKKGGGLLIGIGLMRQSI